MDHLMGRKQYREVSDAMGNPICSVKIPDTSNVQQIFEARKFL